MTPRWRELIRERIEAAKLPPAHEAEIVDEITQHVEDRYHDAIARGLSEAEAVREGLAEIDAREKLAKDLARLKTPGGLKPSGDGGPGEVPGAPRSGRWWGGLVQDVKYALRSFRRAPGFALTVVAVLALTIGPTTAILSIGNWLFWRSPPGVSHPDRLAVVLVGQWRGTSSMSPRSLSDLNTADLLRSSRTLSGLAGWQETSVSLAADGVPPRQVSMTHSTATYFELLGVHPAAGRPFGAEEDVPPFGSPVALIGDRLARGAFGGPQASLGRSVLINGRPLQIIGVMPPGFVGASPFSDVDVWIPSATYFHVRHFPEETMRGRIGRAYGFFYTFIARLAPGASPEALQAELDVLVPALAQQYPKDNSEFAKARARVFPRLGPDEMQRAQYQNLVSSLLLVGGALLLLGCANVANLLLSRGVRRQHEIAVRLALGASRRRIIQQLLTESCVLAFGGAAIGIGLALGLKQLIATLLLPDVAGSGLALDVPLDMRVLMATLGVSMACGLVAGLLPAWMGSSRRVGAAIGRHGQRTTTGRSWVRSGLAVVQLALSLALVTNATLLVVTLRHVGATDIGFDPRSVSLHFLVLGDHGYTTDRAMAFNRDLVSRLAGDPAFRGASLSSGIPPNCGFSRDLVDPAGDGKQTLEICENFITDDFFRTMGQAVVRGRTFTAAETTTPAPAEGAPIVVSESLARRFFGDVSPLGRRMAFPATSAQPGHERVVVGVVRDVRSPLRDPELLAYSPFVLGAAYSARRPTVMVRSDRPLRDAGERVRAHVAAIDPALAMAPPRLLTDWLARQVANRRAFAWVLTLLGGLGFVLAAVGLYGLLAQIVTERAREFGIRMAIGAGRRHVIGLVVRLALWIAILGGAAGLGLAAFGSQLVETQLVGVTRFDLGVYAVSAALLVAVILAACLIPAQRAARVDPVEVLRSE
jgi:predicted permease